MFLNKKDNDLITESGVLKDNNNPLRKEFKTILIEQNDEYLAYAKDQEEAIIEIFLNK